MTCCGTGTNARRRKLPSENINRSPGSQITHASSVSGVVAITVLRSCGWPLAAKSIGRTASMIFALLCEENRRCLPLQSTGSREVLVLFVGIVGGIAVKLTCGRAIYTRL